LNGAAKNKKARPVDSATATPIPQRSQPRDATSGVGGCELIVPTHEEAERVADNDCLSWVKDVEVLSRTFDLEEIVRWALANGPASLR
jgi:hypothetical protein